VGSRDGSRELLLARGVDVIRRREARMRMGMAGHTAFAVVGRCRQGGGGCGVVAHTDGRG
jgi:hypothetical protein